MRTLISLTGRLTGWLDYRKSRALARVVGNRRLRHIRPKNILILCYGNIYRSPFVEYYLNSIKPIQSSMQIKSAGFHEVVDRMSVKDHIEYCRKWGVDLTSHRSKKVTKDMLDWADIIVIMDGHNYKMVKMQSTAALTKIIWLGALSKTTPVEIADPYAKPLEQQQLVVKQLAEASRALVDCIEAVVT